MTVVRIGKHTTGKRLVIIGNGIATGRLLDELVARGAEEQYQIVVLGEEPYGCYNRVLLSRVLAGDAASDIVLKDSSWYEQRGIGFRSGVRVLRIDLRERVVFGARRITEPFDELVIATGSRAVVPQLPGLHNDDSLIDGAFVFRTLDDCTAILNSVSPAQPAVVLGGGLLGLEAAKGLADLGMRVTVVERSAGPMSRQLEHDGQQMLAEHLRRLGIECLGPAMAESVVGGERIESLRLTNGTSLPCRLLILACGVQPRVELMRSAGIPVNKAMMVNQWLTVEGLPHVHGLGECAEIDGELFGTVAPICRQAEVLADVLSGVGRKIGYRRSTTYTKLKVAGVEVASFGEVGDDFDGECLTVTEPRSGLYARLRIANERLVAAQFVGDTRLAAKLLQYHDQQLPVPRHRLELFAEEAQTSTSEHGSLEVCHCHRVSEMSILHAIEQGALDLTSIANMTRAGSGCGSCHASLTRLIRQNAPQPRATAA